MIQEMIVQTAGRLFEKHVTQAVLEEAEEGIWPTALWQALEETELHLISIPEEIGGVGGELVQALTFLHTAARHAAPLPLGELLMVGWLLGSNGHLLPDNLPITVALPDSRHMPTFTQRKSGAWRLTGTVEHVPFARHCTAALVVGSGPTGIMQTLVDLSTTQIIHLDNIAGEPRDTVCFDDVLVAPPHPLDGIIDDCQLRGALFRIVQMAGALETILEKSIRYIGEREQFGRPIAKFQAIQQYVAQLAGEVAAAQAAMHGAILAYDEIATGEPVADQKERAKAAVAMAKIRVGEATGVASRIAHQVHGAMGYTQEYPLHFYTRRLWAWREEFGHESQWADWLGQHLAAQGAERLWEFVASI